MVKDKSKIFLAGTALIGVYAVSKVYMSQTPKPVLPVNVSTININAVGNSKVSGTLTLEDVSGAGVVLLKFPSLADEETVMPAYIREGTCKKMGAVKYTLAVPDAGESETDLEITTAQLKQMAPLVVDLEKSLTNNTVLACAEITK